MKCLNCDAETTGNYCGNCGQSADIHKINTHFVWHDIQHGLFHFDKGILFTAKELLTRPGHSIREFIEGKRIKHFKPISLVIVLATFYGFLFHYFKINILSNNIQINGSGEQFIAAKNMIEQGNEWVSQHYSIVALAQIPFFSIATFLAFKKNGYNFMEHIALNSFLAGQRLLLHLVLFPLYYFFNETAYLKTTARIVDLIGFILFIWSINQFFIHLKLRTRILKSFLSLGIFYVITILILICIVKYIFSIA